MADNNEFFDSKPSVPETPAYEEPAAQAPTFDEPAAQAPTFDEPAAQAPSFDEQVPQTPSYGEPEPLTPSIKEPEPAAQAPSYDRPAPEPAMPDPAPAVQPDPRPIQPETGWSAAPSAPAGNGYSNPADAGNQQADTAPAGKTSADRAAAEKPAREKPPKKKVSLKEWVPGPEFPNQLTIARICMIPLFVILLLWVPKPAGNILAMIVFIVAALTDTADGYIARKYNYVTTFGKFMDPLADKLLVCSALICLVDLGRIESWIVIVIIAREFIISGFRLVAVEKGVVIAANIWGKVKTVIQMLMAILMIGNFGGFLGVFAQILKWFALALTLISLATYLFQNRQVLSDK